MTNLTFDPGALDRKIQVLGLTHNKVKGEAIPTYAEILSIWASKVEAGGSEEEKSGTIVALGQVTWLIYYNTQVMVEIPGYEALKIAEIVGTPVYLLDMGGQVMYDLWGNPLISIDDTTTVLYDILHIEEIGRKVGMQITAQRWR